MAFFTSSLFKHHNPSKKLANKFLVFASDVGIAELPRANTRDRKMEDRKIFIICYLAMPRALILFSCWTASARVGKLS